MSSSQSLKKETSQELFFQKLLKIYETSLNGTSLDKIREKAWDHLLELGLPKVKDDSFQYFPLSRMYKSSLSASTAKAELSSSSFQPLVDKKSAKTAGTIAFIDGEFKEELSTISLLEEAGVEAYSLPEAITNYGSFLLGHLGKSLKAETNPFVALNLALHQNGAFLYIPPKMTLSQPIKILNIVTDSAAKNPQTMISPFLQIFVGKESNISFSSELVILESDNNVEKKEENKNTFIVNNVLDIAIEANSHVKLEQFQFTKDSSYYLMDSVRSSLKQNASLNTVSLTNGSTSTRLDYKATLLGENAEVLLNGISATTSENQVHTYILIDHQAPHCRSHQLFKSLLNEKSRSSFEGKIYVRQKAQKTDAFQLNQNVLLSSDAKAYSKPNLEIFADDVKASHGSTIGQLNEEALLYMKTRGISESQAKKQLLLAFAQEVLSLMQTPLLAEEFSCFLMEL